jgi:hypothetical protein
MNCSCLADVRGEEGPWTVGEERDAHANLLFLGYGHHQSDPSMPPLFWWLLAALNWYTYTPPSFASACLYVHAAAAFLFLVQLDCTSSILFGSVRIHITNFD